MDIEKTDGLSPQPPKPVTQTAVNETLKMVRVDLVFDPNDPRTLTDALGELAVANDIVKQYFSAWRQGFLQIVQPSTRNGKGMWPWKKR